MSAELASGPPPPDLITDLVAEPSNAIALGLGILTASLILLCCCRRKSTLRCRSCITFDSYSDDVEGALLPPTMSRSNDVEPPATPTRLGGPHVIGSATQWSLQGRVAIVTGGSKGLGRAIVEELLAHGCEVLTCARDIKPLEPLTGIGAEPRCVAVSADVSTDDGRRTLLAAFSKHFGRDGALDLLVNNVGTNVRKPSEEFTSAEYEKLHATNQASAFHLSCMCLEQLKRAGKGGLKGGCVVNVSSVSGSTVDNTGCPYHMQKAALEHMTRYLACEWGVHGIRVNAVAPWFIRTPLTEPLLSQQVFHDAVKSATPMRRVGEPYEVACVVAFLAMPAAGYVSGEIIGIDGAMMKEGFRGPK